MRIVFWLLTIPLLAFIGAFASANHQPLVLKFWPFPFEAAMPAYIAILGAFFFGLFLAAILFWTAGLGNRLARRRLARHERALEAETARLKRELAEKERGAVPAIPAQDNNDQARRMIAAGDA